MSDEPIRVMLRRRGDLWQVIDPRIPEDNHRALLAEFSEYTEADRWSRDWLRLRELEIVRDEIGELIASLTAMVQLAGSDPDLAEVDLTDEERAVLTEARRLVEKHKR